MSIALYLRVSKGRGQDTASQEPDLRRWASAQADPATTFTDRMTGKVMDRPGFNRMMEAVRSGRVRTIAVWRLDRLGRTAKGLVDLFSELKALRCNLVSLRDGLDLSTPAGNLMANVLASVAQYETEVRAERVHAGLDAARAAGKRLGPAPGSRKGVRLHVRDEQLQLVVRLKGEGRGVSEIARAVGLSRPTVYRLIAGA